VSALKRAWSLADPLAKGFWGQVAKSVTGKTGNECQSRYEMLYPTPVGTILPVYTTECTFECTFVCVTMRVLMLRLCSIMLHTNVVAAQRPRQSLADPSPRRRRREGRCCHTAVTLLHLCFTIVIVARTEGSNCLLIRQKPTFSFEFIGTTSFPLRKLTRINANISLTL
jgi:hypothetical protein